SYQLNQTHDDAIRNIVGGVNIAGYEESTSTIVNGHSGAMFGSTITNTMSSLKFTIASKRSQITGFDASRVVPTASQNQPITTIENKIIFV
ncbi:Phage tail fibers, partial [Lentimonas sp. CC4]